MADAILDAKASFLIALARALHEAGAPAHRLEDAVDRAARALRVPFDCLSQPTSLILGVGGTTRVLRVHPAPIHLGRLVAIEAVGVEVSRGATSPEVALEQLAAIASAPERFPTWVFGLATGVSSAAAAVFLQANPAGVAAAGALGLGVGLLARLERIVPGYARIHLLAASFAAAAAATALAREVPLSVPTLTLAALIGLLPGLSLTTALTELATGHLASGTARATGAAVTFLQLGLGTSFGWQVSVLLPRALRAAPDPLPPWAPWAALPIAAAAFALTFRARRRDFPAIALVSALAYFAATQGRLHAGPAMGAAVGGLVVGLASNLQARIRRVPTAVTQVPALLLLVPGSIGFTGFGALLDDNVTAGIGATTSMLIIAGSLVAGILAAGVLLPPRRGA